MDINNQKLLKNSYRDYYYWENKIMNNDSLFNGYFDNQKITNHSKIIYTGILNTEKNILECGFVSYPSIYSVLGFIQHIFLSTSFFTWFDSFSNEFCIPMATFDTVIEEVTRYEKNIDINSVNFMVNSYEYINSLWNLNETALTKKLINFTDNFNNKWDNDPEKKLFIKIFDSPSEIYHFIMATIGWDFDEFVEEEISMSLETLHDMCNSVLAEPLINKRFINLLNRNIPILF